MQIISKKYDSNKIDLPVTGEARIDDHFQYLGNQLESVKQMGLKKGAYAIALIKSSWIILSTDRDITTSARNRLEGTVNKIIKGQVNSEIQLNLGAEKRLSCILTNESVNSLKLRKRQTAYALFKASSVILMSD